MKQIYLDYAAATPLDPSVLRAMAPYFTDMFYNPSATYLAAKAVHGDVEHARQQVSQVIGARPAEVLFTAGGTEANNVAINGVMQQYPGAKVLVSAVEHESVIATAGMYSHAEIPVDASGMLDLHALEQLISDDVALVSIMYANNEVGTIQPIHEAAMIIAKVRDARRKAGNTLPIYLHTDATQAANYLDLHVARLGVDLMTLNGGKMYGPKQTGVRYGRAGITLRPLVRGGGQEQGVRSGTENVPGIIGFACALQTAQSMRHEEGKRLQGLQQLFMELVSRKIPESVINGSTKKRLPNNVHVTLPGQDNERVLMALDEAGIMAAAGSACSASDEEPSHVLKAMEISDANAQSSLRFTMGRGTTEQDIKRTVDELARIVA